jgi:penicillin-binding protein 2
MAGKSGTAQVIAIPENYDRADEVPEKYREHAWFISFAPVDNPKIALAVFVEHGEAGSSVAGPIARNILDAYLLDEQGELKAEFIYPQISEEDEGAESGMPFKESVVGSASDTTDSLAEENVNLVSVNQ